MHLEVRSIEDVDRYLDLVRASAARAQQWVANHSGDPLNLLRHMKFEQVGFHPVEDRAPNIIEQINQTWTFVVALLATRQLLQLHPEAEGFKVAPGAHMALELDIMSEVGGLVGAETFAAVDPANNRKLFSDREKLKDRAEIHRYVFFASPLYPGTNRLPRLERHGVQVWSVDLAS